MTSHQSMLGLRRSALTLYPARLPGCCAFVLMCLRARCCVSLMGSYNRRLLHLLAGNTAPPAWEGVNEKAPETRLHQVSCVAHPGRPVACLQSRCRHAAGLLNHDPDYHSACAQPVLQPSLHTCSAIATSTRRLRQHSFSSRHAHVRISVCRMRTFSSARQTRAMSSRLRWVQSGRST